MAKKPNTTHTSSYRRQCNGGFLGKQEAALLFTVRSRLGSRGSWIPTGSSSSMTMPALLFLFPLQPSKGPFLFPPGMFGAPDIFFVWPGPISVTLVAQPLDPETFVFKYPCQSRKRMLVSCPSGSSWVSAPIQLGLKGVTESNFPQLPRSPFSLANRNLSQSTSLQISQSRTHLRAMSNSSWE